MWGILSTKNKRQRMYINVLQTKHASPNQIISHIKSHIPVTVRDVSTDDTKLTGYICKQFFMSVNNAMKTRQWTMKTAPSNEVNKTQSKNAEVDLHSKQENITPVTLKMAQCHWARYEHVKLNRGYAEYRRSNWNSIPKNANGKGFADVASTTSNFLEYLKHYIYYIMIVSITLYVTILFEFDWIRNCTENVISAYSFQQSVTLKFYQGY